MAAFSGYLAVGGAVVDGVLAELPAILRRGFSGDLTGTVLTLPESVTFGPFPAAAGPLNACAVFAAPLGGSPQLSAALPGIMVRANAFLTFPAGVFVMASGAAPGADVLTFNGEPLTVAGQPLQIA